MKEMCTDMTDLSSIQVTLEKLTERLDSLEAREAGDVKQKLEFQWGQSCMWRCIQQVCIIFCELL